jgi:nucleoside-diphosphate-sugar epimerase
MRVFVTGASGWIGSAVVPELLGAGHEVIGLSRSEISAEWLVSVGAEVHQGSLEDVDSLRAGADSAEGVIHLAFIHDFSQYDMAVRTDLRAIAALGEALEGTGRPLLIASGVAAVTTGPLATEEDPAAPAFPRAPAAESTLALAERGVRSGVVRLPPSVHGEGDVGFVPTLIEIARRRGVSAYVDEGSNRWPAVHRLDAARLFRLAFDQAEAGAVLHAVADEGVSTRRIAEVIARHLEIPTISITRDEAAAHFGWMATFFGAIDMAASSALTRERLGWEPTHPGLLEDLEAGHYFRTTTSAPKLLVP